MQTCCDDPRDPNRVFDHTVDHVLTKPGLKTKKAFVTGNDPAETRLRAYGPRTTAAR